MRSTERLLLGLTLLLLTAANSAIAQTASTPPEAQSGAVNSEPLQFPLEREALMNALVEYRTAWQRGYGFLLRDQQTIVAPGLEGGRRRITVRRVNADGTLADQRVRVARVIANPEEIEIAEDMVGMQAAVLLELEEPLEGTPLTLSSQSPQLSDTLWTVARLEDEAPTQDGLELVTTTVTAATENSLSLGAPTSTCWQGAPIFDAEGQIVAFQGCSGRSPRSARVVDAQAQEQRSILQPLLGFRLGTTFGRFDSPSLDIQLELGVTLWDQLGLALRIGSSIGGTGLHRLQATDGLGEGVVNQSSSALDLAFEARYRLMLNSGRFPIYLDFVAGLQYSATFHEPSGPAFYATEPGCDPMGGSCGVTIGDTPRRQIEHGVGATFGADLRLGLLAIGYRFTPAALSHNLPNMHTLSFGLAF